MAKDFVADFNRFKNKIISKENFAYTRYADGEIRLMSGVGVGTHTQAFQQDGWCCGNKMYELGKTLLESISHTESNYVYAITSPNQNFSDYKFLRDRIQQTEQNITFADLWINGNYPLFQKFIHDELQEEIVFIASDDGIGRSMLPLKCKKYVAVPRDCVNFYEQQRKEIESVLDIMASEYTDTLFFISAGPLSEAIIHYLYCKNPNNRYIDVGSAIDEIVHGKKTRPYMIEGTQYHGEIVQWTI
jgi:hypothetical protein